MAELTPMKRQYYEIKQRNPDCLLFFRLGDFYEMFYDDALLDRFVQESTRFSTWDEMIQTATDLHFQPAVCS